MRITGPLNFVCAGCGKRYFGSGFIESEKLICEPCYRKALRRSGRLHILEPSGFTYAIDKKHILAASPDLETPAPSMKQDVRDLLLHR